MMEVGGAVYKLVPTAETHQQAMATFSWQTRQRGPVVAFAFRGAGFVDESSWGAVGRWLDLRIGWSGNRSRAD